ncbi:hypothetical protein YC2023_121991 [Brassica napus]
MLKCPGPPSTTPSNSLSSGTSGDPTSSSPSFSSPEATGSPLILEPPASPSVSSLEPSSFSSSSPTCSFGSSCSLASSPPPLPMVMLHSMKLEHICSVETLLYQQSPQLPRVHLSALK